MFQYTVTIRLRDTDATGILFFTEQLRLALETFEEFLKSAGFTLDRLFQATNCLMPIVHAEADYFAPLQAGDEVQIALEVGRLGTSSFTLLYRFVKAHTRVQVGLATIIHVTVSKAHKKPMPIPQPLVLVLQKLQREPADCPDLASSRESEINEIFG